MIEVEQEPSVTRPASKLYSVPRRYDLATLFVVSLAYALLFGIFRLVTDEPAKIGFAGLFVTAVGLGQALLFGGRSPRSASMVVGTPLWGTFCVYVWGLVGNWGVFSVGEWALLGTVLAFHGVVLSYCAGTLVAGVFLVADKVRQRFASRHPREPPKASPWAEEAEASAGEEQK